MSTAGTFWLNEYRRKAQDPDPLVQSGRGTKFGMIELLHTLREMLTLLALDRSHDLLDVGCANGLLDIPLSACCRRLAAVEPVPELAERAMRNLEHCDNVRVTVEDAARLSADDDSFDRALVLEVLQLVEPDSAKRIFAELKRVVRRTGRIVLGNVPDARLRSNYLAAYLENLQRAEHLSREEKDCIRERNLSAHWYDPAELISCWRALGARARSHSPDKTGPNANHRFHLIVTIEK